MGHSNEDIKKFVKDCRAEEERERGQPFSAMESNFWDMAELSPYEQTRIITTNEKVLADPYLMRVYLTPERELLAAWLYDMGVPGFITRRLNHMPRPYLHYFFRGDDDRAYHNHPWKRSLSFILLGGYIEHKWDFVERRSTSKLLEPGRVNYLKRGTYHRVELLPHGQKCWTCFVSTGRVQASDGTDWEFYDPETNTFTPWGQWTAASARHRPFREEARVVPAAVPGVAVVGKHIDDLGADPNAGHGGYDWSSLQR